MSNMNTAGIRTTGRAFEGQFFAVYRGESLGDAIMRHRRANGIGPLVLMRDFNAVQAAGRRARYSLAA